MTAVMFLLVLVMLAAFFTWTDVRYGYGLYRFRRSSTLSTGASPPRK